MNKISLVYYIAGMKSKKIDYKKAIRLAESFTREELIRLYILTKARMQ